jgi:hypothetical protein
LRAELLRSGLRKGLRTQLLRSGLAVLRVLAVRGSQVQEALGFVQVPPPIPGGLVQEALVRKVVRLDLWRFVRFGLRLRQ